MSDMRQVLAATMLFTICCLSAVPPARAEKDHTGPRITSPKDKQHIGEDGDPNCPDARRACSRIRAEGWIPEGLVPFLAVAPLLASPNMWIQPPIQGAKSDGTLSGLVYLGEGDKGAGEYFKIYLFACASEDRFAEGEVIQQLPDDCQVSEPVKVYRGH